MTTETEATRERLITDFKAVVADTEDLLHATANQAGEKVTAVRGRIQERLRLAKAQLDDAETSVVNKAKAAAHETDTYVHEHPWTAAGVAAGVGLLIGMLISRR